MILSALNMPQETDPPYASTLIFELWKNINNKHEVRLLYNDVELDLYRYCHKDQSSPDGNKRCDLDLFTKRILKETVADTKSVCYGESDTVVKKS